MRATHTKSTRQKKSQSIEILSPDITMWGGPKGTHIYIFIPRSDDDLNTSTDLHPHLVGTVSSPSSPDDLIRMILPTKTKTLRHH